MSRGVNKVILVGNLGNEPEARYLPSGSAVTTISIATTKGWVDKESGDRQERTEWHRVVLFNRLGEIAAEYLHKGSKVYLEGELRTRKWQDKNNQDRYTTEIVANDMQMLDSRTSAATSNPMMGQTAGNNAKTPLAATHANQASSMPDPVAESDFDDDIPF